MLGQVVLDVTFLAYRGVFLLDAIVPHPCADVLDAAQAAGVGDRRVDRAPFARGAAARRYRHVDGARTRGCDRCDCVCCCDRAALPAAALFLAAWFFSPVVAFQVSQPRRPSRSHLTDAERRALRRIARKTWHFFMTFVGDDDHWLPPDNFQESPGRPDRPSDLADQHGALARLDPGGPRSRLHQPGHPARAARADL